MTPFELAVVLILAGFLVLAIYRTAKPKPQMGQSLLGTWFDKANPIWLPRGTVRAILVLIAMIAVVYPIFKLVTLGGTLDPAVKEIMLVLVGGLIGLVKDYITSRDSANGNGTMVVKG